MVRLQWLVTFLLPLTWLQPLMRQALDPWPLLYLQTTSWTCEWTPGLKTQSQRGSAAAWRVGSEPASAQRLTPSDSPFSQIPTGMKIAATIANATITQVGVRMGCHARRRWLYKLPAAEGGTRTSKPGHFDLGLEQCGSATQAYGRGSNAATGERQPRRRRASPGRQAHRLALARPAEALATRAVVATPGGPAAPHSHISPIL